MMSFQTQNTHLGLSDLDDPMELSGDAERRGGQEEDIDLDLEAVEDDQLDEEDAYMGEGADSPMEPPSGDINGNRFVNDDEMVDDNYHDDFLIGTPSVKDEEIQDVAGAEQEFGRDQVQGYDITDQPTVDNPELAPAAEATGTSDYTEVTQLYGTDHEAENAGALSRDGLEEGTVPQAQSIKLPSEVQEHDKLEVAPTLLDTHSETQNLSESLGEHEEASEAVRRKSTEFLDGPEPQIVVEPKTEFQAEKPASLLQDNQVDPIASSKEANEGSSTTKHVHPIVVTYQGVDMSLFPPVHEGQEHSETFFLQDERFAEENMSDLLGACRAVLAESISPYDELFMSVDDLGLCVTEFATDSSSISLAQILDLYTQLQQLDGVQAPPPLYVNLYTNSKLSNRLEFLRNELANGKGLSSIRPEYSRNDRLQESYETDNQTFEVPPNAQTSETGNEYANASSIREQESGLDQGFTNVDPKSKSSRSSPVPENQKEDSDFTQLPENLTSKPETEHIVEIDNGKSKNDLQSIERGVEDKSKTSDYISSPHQRPPQLAAEYYLNSGNKQSADEDGEGYEAQEGDQEEEDEDDLNYEDEEDEENIEIQDSSAGSSTLQGEIAAEARKIPETGDESGQVAENGSNEKEDNSLDNEQDGNNTDIFQEVDADFLGENDPQPTGDSAEVTQGGEPQITSAAVQYEDPQPDSFSENLWFEDDADNLDYQPLLDSNSVSDPTNGVSNPYPQGATTLDEREEEYFDNEDEETYEDENYPGPLQEHGDVLSNPLKNEMPAAQDFPDEPPRLSDKATTPPPAVDQFDDKDEITYEDEEDGFDAPQAGLKDDSSPKSLKRPRSSSDTSVTADDHQDSKRIRSD